MRTHSAIFLLLAAAPASAMTLAEVVNPYAHPRDTLSNLGVVRGQGVRRHPVQVGAQAGEAWQVVLENLPGLEVVPPQGTGPATVDVTVVSLSAAALDGAVVLQAAGGAEAARLDVHVKRFPVVPVDAPASDVKLPSAWPQDPDYADAWALWGFLPDRSSHPARNVHGVEGWEATPCPSGGACTAEGQAGLAAGLSADRAWARTTGNRDVVLAVLDTGMDWRNPDLWEQVRLNAAEVSCPPPGALPGSPASYDVNGDGVFTIRDYDTADLEDFNHNGARDPGDLLGGTADGQACTNGLDDDSNGYVDDIAGWNFLQDTNDPFDLSGDGHGTRLALAAAGQAMNGVGSVGVCPSCRVLPLRVGDSKVVGAARLAEAIVYAVDNEARVVVAGVQSLSHSAFLEDAVDYAFESNVPVVGAAGDRGAAHGEWPGASAHALMVNAVVPDTLRDRSGAGWEGATTYLHRNACSNRSARLDVTAPGAECSGEAAARTGGVAGLLLAQWRALRESTPGDAYLARDLTASEVYGLLVAGAEDVAVPGALTDAAARAQGTYASGPGWDENFGYGRVNAARSLALLADHRVPPELEVTSPAPSAFIRAVAGGNVEVRARVQSLRTDAEITWRVRWGRGRAPSDAELEAHVVASGPLDGGRVQDIRTFGAIQVDDVLASREPGEAGTLDDGVVTVEVTASVTTAHGPTLARARRTFSLVQDPTLHEPFPLRVASSGESSPKFADVDDDGRQELVVATADGELTVLGNRGSPIQGFPVQLVTAGDTATCGGAVLHHADQVRGVRVGAIHASPAAAVFGAPAVSRLDGDRRHPSIAVATTGGALFVVDHLGTLRENFPVCMAEPIPGRGERLEATFLSSPMVLEDQNDEDRVIYLGGGDGWLYAWRANGTVRQGFPVELRHPVPDGGTREVDRVVASPAAADLDGDGTYEVVLGSNERIPGDAHSFVYAVHADGDAHAGGAFLGSPEDPTWPAALPTGSVDEVLPLLGTGQAGSAAATDLDNDGKDEVLVAGAGGTLEVLTATGRWAGAPAMSTTGLGADSPFHATRVVPRASQTALADLDGDGKTDVIHDVVGDNGASWPQPSGQRLDVEHGVAAWDTSNATFKKGFPALLADEGLLMDYPVADVDGDGKPEVVVASQGGLIHALRADGSQPPGWPKVTGGSIQASPALGDADGDGLLELAAVTREGWVFLWDLGGPVDSVQWAGFRHDVHNTGNARIHVPDRKMPAACACHGTTQPRPWAPALAILAAWSLVRRRGRRC